MAGTYGSPVTDWNERSGGAVGSTAFAGTLMVIQGSWSLVAGLMAFANGRFLVVSPDYILRFDTSTWAWIQVALGLVIVAAGVAVLSGAAWARIVGVSMAMIASVAAFGWLPYHPLWASLLIALSLGVIGALTAPHRDGADLG
jgi:hypothetical protein